MSPETAALVHYGILAVAIVVWSLALIVHRRAFPPADPHRPEPVREGQETVPAPVGVVRDRLVASLRGGGIAGPGSIRIEEASDRRIRGSAAPVLGKGRHGSALGFTIELEESGSGTRARYSLDGPPSRGLRIASALFVYLLGPVAIVAAIVVMRTWVLGSDSPAVRTQAIQTMHVLHFLWPPFLFAYVSRRLADAVATALGNLIRNTGF